MTQLQLAEKLGVSDKTVSKIKLYPEGNAEARFKIRGVKKLYWYCNRDSLFFIDVVKGIDEREGSHDHIQEQRELEMTAKMLFG